MVKLKDNGFHVKLDGVELSAESRKRIQAGIQDVILRELAGYFPNPDGDDQKVKHLGSGVIVVPPRYWWGFILRSLRQDEIGGIKGWQNEINAPTYESGGFRQ